MGTVTWSTDAKTCSAKANHSCRLDRHPKEKVAFRLVVSESSYGELEQLWACQGLQPLVSRATFFKAYRKIAPGLERLLAKQVQDDRDYYKLLLAAGARVPVEIDAAFSHRGSDAACCDVLAVAEVADPGRCAVLGVDIPWRALLLGYHQAYRVTPSDAGATRAGPGGLMVSARALEGIGVQLMLAEMHASGVVIKDVVVDSGNRFQALLRVHWPRVNFHECILHTLRHIRTEILSWASLAAGVAETRLGVDYSTSIDTKSAFQQIASVFTEGGTSEPPGFDVVIPDPV